MNVEDWKKVIAQIRSQCAPRLTWHEAEIFCEVEAVLHLYQTLQPRAGERNAAEAWVLLSGYAIPELNASQADLQKCLKLRCNLRYVRTASAWTWWLKWYMRLPAAKPLFSVRQDEAGILRFEQRLYDIPLCPERLETYTRLFMEYGDYASRPPRPFASTGHYTFEIDQVAYGVAITDEMARVANTATPSRALPCRNERRPINVHWAELLQAAKEIDSCETDRRISPKGNWENRLQSMRLAALAADDTTSIQEHLTLDRLIHLVGALGVGKSSLIWVLTYLLAKRGLHVTVVFSTVVEAYRFAAWLQRLGVSAAPALGANRVDHARKVGWANAQELSISRVLRPDASPQPILDWLPSPCALRGALSAPISQVGSEPCYRLIGADGEHYRCPLLPVCPVHNVRRDLVTSQVWAANPMSLLFSPAPDGIGDAPMRLFDAVHHLSDLVIIDEADRVQLQWDRAFAPTEPLAGSDDSLLDRLHALLGAASSGSHGRRRAAQTIFNRLTRDESQTSILTNHVFRLLSKSPKNARWIKDRQLTNHGMFGRLAVELTRTLPRGSQRKAKAIALRNTFREFWLHPLRRENGELAAWVHSLLGTDMDEKKLRRALEGWLAHQMGWPTPLREKRKLLLARLELCVTISAMLRQANNVCKQLPWAAELDMEKAAYPELPDSISNLVPDPLLGLLLGARLNGYRGKNKLGVISLLRCQGVGRWLLLNLPDLYVGLTGEPGPHVLLTSATSWFPGASQFDLAVPPQAILLPKENAPASWIDISFRPMSGQDGQWICVSGAGIRRESNLRQIVRELAKNGAHTPSDLQRELDHWQDKGTSRRILLVVGSYEQAGWVLNELNSQPQWRERALRLLPDDSEIIDEHTLRTREVEHLRSHNADVLIAPLLAIQRGFNILDEAEEALLGSVFFLVRPYPPPDDMTPQILSLNAWTIGQLDRAGRRLCPEYSGVTGLHQLRRLTHREWHKRLSAGRHGLKSMSDGQYDEFLRNQFVVVWQTIGRLLRGARDARVFFVDGAFSAGQGTRHMLLDWHSMLQSMLTEGGDSQHHIADQLYRPIGDAFQRAVDTKDIY